MRMNMHKYGLRKIHLTKLNSYSSYRPVSMYQWHAHSRAVVFHTLHRGQRYARICPYLVYCATLYPLPLPQLQESSVLTPLIYYTRPPSSAFAAAVTISIYPVRSSPACSHHHIPTCAPQLISAASHISRIGRVEIYCATVFRLRQM